MWAMKPIATESRRTAHGYCLWSDTYAWYAVFIRGTFGFFHTLRKVIAGMILSQLTRNGIHMYPPSLSSFTDGLFQGPEVPNSLAVTVLFLLALPPQSLTERSKIVSNAVTACWILDSFNEIEASPSRSMKPNLKSWRSNRIKTRPTLVQRNSFVYDFDCFACCPSISKAPPRTWSG